MAIQIQGNGGVVAEVDGTNFRALRIVQRPIDYGVLGFYAMSQQTGTMAAGLTANAEVLQFRWTDATRIAAIFHVACDGGGNDGTAFAAGFTKLEGVVARSWSADGSGGTAATITGNNNKLRTSMGTTLAGAIRISSTAALTAGTKTLDSQGFGATLSGATATAGAQIFGPDDIFNAEHSNHHPLILAQNEGFIVRATVPATGTWTAGLTLRWVELTSY
jgi:hypothetical protein